MDGCVARGRGSACVCVGVEAKGCKGVCKVTHGGWPAAAHLKSRRGSRARTCTLTQAAAATRARSCNGEGAHLHAHAARRGGGEQLVQVHPRANSQREVPGVAADHVVQAVQE